ncbi:hypothetical protein F5I97DRAFT_1830508 [Phlebopus sp. FC_14]|nr:hypothetical protein F5I97DRAFT_1830508 [Phlebopus sp. FC_14]
MPKVVNIMAMQRSRQAATPSLTCAQIPSVRHAKTQGDLPVDSFCEYKINSTLLAFATTPLAAPHFVHRLMTAERWSLLACCLRFDAPLGLIEHTVLSKHVFNQTLSCPLNAICLIFFAIHSSLVIGGVILLWFRVLCVLHLGDESLMFPVVQSSGIRIFFYKGRDIRSTPASLQEETFIISIQVASCPAFIWIAKTRRATSQSRSGPNHQFGWLCMACYGVRITWLLTLDGLNAGHSLKANLPQSGTNPMNIFRLSATGLGTL